MLRVPGHTLRAPTGKPGTPKEPGTTQFQATIHDKNNRMPNGAPAAAVITGSFRAALLGGVCNERTRIFRTIW